MKRKKETAPLQLQVEESVLNQLEISYVDFKKTLETNKG
jgi:hypothetical protein